MTDIKIIPYTVITIVGEKDTSFFQLLKIPIVQLLKSHDINYLFFDNAISNELLEKELMFPTANKVVVLCVNSKEEVDDIKAIALKHNFSNTIFTENNYITEKEIPDIQNLNLQEPTFLIYETNLNVCKHIDDLKVCVIGDIHGDFEGLKKILLDDKGIKLVDGKIVVTDKDKYVKHILVGDYIDKGTFKGIKRTIEFIYNNLEHFYVIVGNHEHWTAEYLNKKFKHTADTAKLIGNWFTTTILLLEDEELREKFFKIYNNSYSSIDTPFAIITHAPCENKYLYKENAVAIKQMRNLRLPVSNDYDTWDEYCNARDIFFSFLKDDASQSNKFHIFGHAVVPEPFKFKNKICIDTGAGYSGSLSTANINDEGDITFKSYKCDKKDKELLIPFFKD